MTQAALAHSPARAYAESIAATFERVLADDVPQLREPTSDDGQRALQIVGLVVETIVGFAHGLVVGELERAAHVWLDAGAPSLRDVAMRGPALASSDRFLADAGTRPLVDELGACLRPRLRYAASDLARLVATLPAHPAMFAHLRERSLLDERLRGELAHGWVCACAAIERAPLPRIQGSARSRALWQAWARLAGLERSVRETYIVHIAG
jgi:hypothetical protein